MVLGDVKALSLKGTGVWDGWVSGENRDLNQHRSSFKLPALSIGEADHCRQVIA